MTLLNDTVYPKNLALVNCWNKKLAFYHSINFRYLFFKAALYAWALCFFPSFSSHLQTAYSIPMVTEPYDWFSIYSEQEISPYLQTK